VPSSPPDRITRQKERFIAMSILKSLHRRKRALVALTTLAASLAVLTVGAPTAGAAGCATLGHVYLTQPGRAIVSG
jgi:hypothetical protein